MGSVITRELVTVNRLIGRLRRVITTVPLFPKIDPIVVTQSLLSSLLRSHSLPIIIGPRCQLPIQLFPNCIDFASIITNLKHIFPLCNCIMPFCTNLKPQEFLCSAGAGTTRCNKDLRRSRDRKAVRLLSRKLD